MPNRLLREGICTSDPINELNPEEEVLFYRLLVVADDFGHMDGRPAIIKAQCFPLKETATVARIETWVAGLAKKSMLARYTIDGRRFLAVLKWEARVRTNPKYPQPTAESWEGPSASCAQCAAKLPHSAAECGLGKGMGKGKGASNDNEVVFDAHLGSFSIPATPRQQWVGAYPALSLDAEIAKASGWLLSNPKNAKSNYARFLTNWLSKVQDKAPRVNGAAGPGDRFSGRAI